jgi:ATP-dependent RNA helicase HelY
MRLQRDIEDLQRQISGRSHVIARTFERVCAVLEELGYLDGDTVTPDGRRLGGIYSELDLLAAECLRRGLWKGLNPAELAACVSVLTFESRQQADDTGPARLPKGPVGDVLADMIRTWTELDQMERRNGLSFLRESDLGFVWAAYRWARGAKLEDVLESVPGLTPGDFVRAVKQLMDLLDQIAGVAGTDAALPDAEMAGSADADPAISEQKRERGVAATARAAIDAMRRGVVAYTALTE